MVNPHPAPGDPDTTAELPPLLEPWERSAHHTLRKTTPQTARETDDLWDDEPAPSWTPDTAPRGLQRDGTIRTTGWLQLGTYPVSSGLWAALLGLATGTALTGLTPAAPLILAALGYLAWKTTTRWIRPASTAINLARLNPTQLHSGMLIRLHGPIGPVGVIRGIGTTGDRVHILLDGGDHQLLTERSRCYTVELRD